VIAPPLTGPVAPRTPRPNGPCELLVQQNPRPRLAGDSPARALPGAASPQPGVRGRSVPTGRVMSGSTRPRSIGPAARPSTNKRPADRRKRALKAGLVGDIRLVSRKGRWFGRAAQGSRAPRQTPASPWRESRRLRSLSLRYRESSNSEVRPEVIGTLALQRMQLFRSRESARAFVSRRPRHGSAVDATLRQSGRKTTFPGRS